MADRTGKIGPPLKQNATKAIIYKMTFKQKLKNLFQNKDPQYTCSLTGCKSAWGSASEMYNHLTSSKNKHNRNYLNKFYQIANLTVDQIFNQSRIIFDEKKEENNGRVNYNIKQISNQKEYSELKNRPLNWLEAKDKRSR